VLLSQNPLLEKIAVYGNTRTQDHIILRELCLREQEPISDELLRQDRAWLLRQDFLKRIEFQMKGGSTQDQRILLLVVQEKGTWSINPILSNNDLFGWYTGAHLTTYNVWGRRNRIDAIFQTGGIQKFALSWYNPWFGGTSRIFAQIQLYFTTFLYCYGDRLPPFDERDIGVRFTLGKGFGRRIRIGLHSTLEQVWSDDPGITQSGSHDDELLILEPFLLFDSRDWPLYPKTGLFLRSGIQYVKPLPSEWFLRTDIDLRLYFPVFRENILAINTVARISRGPIPVYKRIHLGGGKTIRGFGTGALPGESSLLMSFEYRFPILYERNPLAGIHVGYAGVVFIDTGAAWYQNQVLKHDLWKTSIGFGIHVIWDHWILRVEYGNRVKGWGFINAGTGIKF